MSNSRKSQMNKVERAQYEAWKASSDKRAFRFPPTMEAKDVPNAVYAAVAQRGHSVFIGFGCENTRYLTAVELNPFAAWDLAQRLLQLGAAAGWCAPDGRFEFLEPPERHQ